MSFLLNLVIWETSSLENMVFRILFTAKSLILATVVAFLASMLTEWEKSSLSTNNEESVGGYIRSPLVRTLHEKFQHQRKHSQSNHDEWYLVRRDYFKPEMMQKFVQSHQDKETEAFLTKCFEKSDWIFTHFYHAIAKAVLTWFMTSTSINGLLRRGSMFVVSSKQFASLLSIEAGFQYESLLDLGAGDGMVTDKMAPFFRQVYTTELSRPMRWRLREHGFTVLDADTWDSSTETGTASTTSGPVPSQFDVISCLNLLDRCDTPLTMLKRIAKALKPRSGRLILGIVLPLKQYVEMNPDNAASELLDLPESTSWEVQLNHLISHVLAEAGFELMKWTRVPYLCEGDFTQSFYYLNELVLVLRARDTRVVQSGIAGVH